MQPAGTLFGPRAVGGFKNCFVHVITKRAFLIAVFPVSLLCGSPMWTLAPKSRGVFATLLLFALSLASLHTQTSPAESTNWRSKLPEVQLATRQLAHLHNLIKRGQMENFHSVSLKTGSEKLLQAHCLYEEAVQEMLGGRDVEALLKIDQAISVVKALPGRDQPALRRLVLAKEALTEPAPAKAFQARIALIADTVQKQSIPTTEVGLTSQYLLEQWFTSAEMILRAWSALETAPRQPQAQAGIVEKTATQICAEKTLLSALTAEADTSVMQHEVLLDQLVFQNRQGAIFGKIFSCLTERVKTLPNALQPAAFALFTFWCGETTGEVVAIPMDDKLLSPEEMADYFGFLDSLLSITQVSGLEKIRERMAESVPLPVLERCPANEAGLQLADALIDGGQIDRAMKLAKKLEAENPKLAPQVARLEIKSKVESGQWTEAVQIAEAALRLHGRESMPPDALYLLAEAQVKTDQSTEAIRNFKEFVDRSPGSRLAPTAALMAGLLHLNQQKLEEAKADFEFTARTYPHSPAAEKALSFLAISTRQGDSIMRDPRDTR